MVESSSLYMSRFMWALDPSPSECLKKERNCYMASECYERVSGNRLGVAWQGSVMVMLAEDESMIVSVM